MPALHNFIALIPFVTGMRAGVASRSCAPNGMRFQTREQFVLEKPRRALLLGCLENALAVLRQDISYPHSTVVCVFSRVLEKWHLKGEIDSCTPLACRLLSPVLVLHRASYLNTLSKHASDALLCLYVLCGRWARFLCRKKGAMTRM
jgi:hypothetical protein